MGMATLMTSTMMMRSMMRGMMRSIMGNTTMMQTTTRRIMVTTMTLSTRMTARRSTITESCERGGQERGAEKATKSWVFACKFHFCSRENDANANHSVHRGPLDLAHQLKSHVACPKK